MVYSGLSDWKQSELRPHSACDEAEGQNTAALQEQFRSLYLLSLLQESTRLSQTIDQREIPSKAELAQSVLSQEWRFSTHCRFQSHMSDQRDSSEESLAGGSHIGNPKGLPKTPKNWNVSFPETRQQRNDVQTAQTDSAGTEGQWHTATNMLMVTKSENRLAETPEDHLVQALIEKGAQTRLCSTSNTSLGKFDWLSSWFFLLTLWYFFLTLKWWDHPANKEGFFYSLGFITDNPNNVRDCLIFLLLFPTAHFKVVERDPPRCRCQKQY